MADRRLNWVVNITTQESGEPLTFGPYTKDRTLELAEKFNTWVERKGWEWVEKEYEFIHAGAMPIQKLGIRGMIAEFDHE